jgi:hypothetical protein
MKKISVMVVVALMSASMFANSANLPTKAKKVNSTSVKAAGKPKQDKDKTKSKDKAATKEKTAHKKAGKEQKANQIKAQK